MVKTTFAIALYFVCESPFLFIFLFQPTAPQISSNIYFQCISVKLGWEECEGSSLTFLCLSLKRVVGNLNFKKKILMENNCYTMPG